MSKIDPVIPTVNLNGTDGKVLLDGYVKAMELATALGNHLATINPHGRDFQLAPEKYEPAREQHSEIRNKLEQIYAHLEAVAIGIHNQLNG